MWHHYKQLLCQKFRSLLRLTTTRCIGVIKPNRQLLGQEYRHRLFCYKWQAWLPSVRHSSSLCPFRFSSSTTSQRQTDLKPFKAIPGPRPLPFVGNLFRYIIGEYSFNRLHINGIKKYEKFGPIVREEIIPGVHLVLLFNPNDIERMYQVEGKYPSRRSHTALEFYRLNNPEFYNTGGLLPTNGPEWHRLRVPLQRPINVTENIRLYVSAVDYVAGEFVEDLARSITQNRQSPDFLDDLSRVFMEFIGLVTLDTRLGSLDKNLPENALPLKLIKAAYDTNSRILSTDNGLQLWRRLRLNTPSYRTIKESQEYIEKVVLHYVHSKIAELKQQNSSDSKKRKTLLEEYLSLEDLDVKDVVTMIADMLLAGVDTSSYTMGFILYHLAKNVSKQDELHAEIKRLLPRYDSPVTEDILSSSELKYLKAVVKETFRLNPISIGVGRILPEDASFSGYHCPKNTVLVTQNQVSSRLPCYVNNPDRFMPERWIKGHPAYEKLHPYLVLPFGHGPRSCIARRLAEQNIYILLAKMMRRFRVEWQGNELDCKSVLINRPDGPLQFHFHER